jgi:predicted transcriptional regulator
VRIRRADVATDRVNRSVVGIVVGMTVSISITLDDDLGADLNEASAGGNRSALVAEAIREYLDRRAVEAARAWHASLRDEDAAAFQEFNSTW